MAQKKNKSPGNASRDEGITKSSSDRFESLKKYLKESRDTVEAIKEANGLEAELTNKPMTY